MTRGELNGLKKAYIASKERYFAAIRQLQTECRHEDLVYSSDGFEADFRCNDCGSQSWFDIGDLEGSVRIVSQEELDQPWEP
jgi:hypothetical protein